MQRLYLITIRYFVISLTRDLELFGCDIGMEVVRSMLLQALREMIISCVQSHSYCCADACTRAYIIFSREIILSVTRHKDLQLEALSSHFFWPVKSLKCPGCSRSINLPFHYGIIRILNPQHFCTLIIKH